MVLHSIANIDVFRAVVVAAHVRCNFVLLEQRLHMLDHQTGWPMLTDTEHRIMTRDNDKVGRAGRQSLTEPLQLGISPHLIHRSRKLTPLELNLFPIATLHPSPTVAAQNNGINVHKLQSLGPYLLGPGIIPAQGWYGDGIVMVGIQ